MPIFTRRAVVAALAAAAASAAVATADPAAAAAASSTSAYTAGAVFVQLNSPDGNAVAAYSRGRDGRLASAGRFSTGGNGGTAVAAPVDPLASQDSLVLASGRSVLLAVNAGSNTVTSFAVRGAHLRRTSTVASGGQFPVSIAVHGNLVYVLNSGGAGSVSGFRLHGARLVPLGHSTRALGLANTTPPNFLTGPGQVGISPDGAALVVTTKAGGSLLGFAVHDDGRLSDLPVSTPSAGPVPFSFAWTGTRTIQVTQAGDGAIASYRVADDGAATLISTSQPSGGTALCWVTRAGRTLVGANTGSGTLSTWKVTPSGSAVLATAVAAAPGGAPIDLDASRDGRFVYVQNPAGGQVQVYQVTRGALTLLQTVHGLPVVQDGSGMEGIAAT